MSDSESEDRFVLIGSSHKNPLLIVIPAEHEEIIRIVSARKATKDGREQYEENAKRSRKA